VTARQNHHMELLQICMFVEPVVPYVRRTGEKRCATGSSGPSSSSVGKRLERIHLVQDETHLMDMAALLHMLRSALHGSINTLHCLLRRHSLNIATLIAVLAVSSAHPSRKCIRGATSAGV
jgi:hypothetical protein